jgi:pyruvate/2-oxoglutarate dehydrogenase complex dihydrolipoamide acyltransferase (E2) component
VSQQVTVPDIGDFTDVPIIEVLVSPGDTVAAEDPLIVLESDKASMDVPSPEAGTVGELLVKVGDKVSQGTPILTLETDGAGPAEEPAAEPRWSSPPHRPAAAAGIASTCSCSARAWAATPPPSAPPTSGSTS